MRFRHVWLLALFGSLSGCLSTRIYPICYYDGGDSVKASRDDISKFVVGVTGSRSSIAFSPNERFIVLEALESKHQALTEVWPRVGCIGKSRYDVEYLRCAGCVYMIQDAIRGGGVPRIGTVSDSIQDSSIFYCGMPLASLILPTRIQLVRS